MERIIKNPEPRPHETRRNTHVGMFEARRRKKWFQKQKQLCLGMRKSCGLECGSATGLEYK